MEQDGEALHKSVMAAGYRGQELNTLDVPFDYPTFEKSYKYVDSKISKIKRLLTLNGLFPACKRKQCGADVGGETGIILPQEEGIAV